MTKQSDFGRLNAARTFTIRFSPIIAKLLTVILVHSIHSYCTSSIRLHFKVSTSHRPLPLYHSTRQVTLFVHFVHIPSSHKPFIFLWNPLLEQVDVSTSIGFANVFANRKEQEILVNLKSKIYAIYIIHHENR